MFKKKSILDTGIKSVRNVNRFNFGFGSLKELPQIMKTHHKLAVNNYKNSYALYLIDDFFINKKNILKKLKIKNNDFVIFIRTKNEPTTDLIDKLVNKLKKENKMNPYTIVGFGGGTTLDTAKALANLLTNGGKAADYQGWDLVKVPAIHKIGIPTISGTGAEATRTCVMTNTKNGLKLGMNSDYTVFDHLILDPQLTATVPRNQYFYTGIDAYIHCFESLSGSYRNMIGDSFARETLNLCKSIFLDKDMMKKKCRENLMVASYLGGSAIGTSYVGIVHPFSAGLSVVLGLHHCIANCITMRAMKEFYPEFYKEFWLMVDKQRVKIPKEVCTSLTNTQYKDLIKATIIHEKPLTNALGNNFRKILTDKKIIEIFKRM